MSRQTEPKWAVSGVIEARPEKVWEALIAANPALTEADKKAIRNGSDSPITFTSGKPGEGKIQVEVDKKRRSIAIQGEWWYRGVHSVEQHKQGSLLVYRIYNIAPGVGWWMARFVQGPQVARSMKSQFEALLANLSKQLGVSARLTA